LQLEIILHILRYFVAKYAKLSGEGFPDEVVSSSRNGCSKKLNEKGVMSLFDCISLHYPVNCIILMHCVSYNIFAIFEANFGIVVVIVTNNVGDI
jgi:hypothetical protein